MVVDTTEQGEGPRSSIQHSAVPRAVLSTPPLPGLSLELKCVCAHAVLYDQYGIGSAFDPPTQNTINDSIIAPRVMHLSA